MHTIKFYKKLDNINPETDIALIDLHSSDIEFLIEAGFYRLGGNSKTQTIEIDGEEIDIEILELNPSLAFNLMYATKIAYNLNLENGGGYKNDGYEMLLYHLRCKEGYGWQSSEWRYIERIASAGNTRPAKPQDLKQLFAEADRIGSKYQTEEERQEFKQAMDREIAEIMDLLTEQLEADEIIELDPKAGQPYSGYFISEDAELIYKILHLDGKERRQALGITRRHYTQRSKIREQWYRELSEKLTFSMHEDAELAKKELDRIYRQIKGEA